MNSRIGFIDNHQEIFKIDLSYLSGQNLINQVLLLSTNLEQLEDHVKLVVDLTGCRLTADSLGFLKIAGKKAVAYARPFCLYGLSSQMRLLLSKYVHFAKLNLTICHTQAEALSYLKFYESMPKAFNQ